MLISNNDDLVKRFEVLRAFGMDKHVGVRKLPGMYDVQKLGFNYRMNEIQAAIGVEQMKRLDGFLEARARNYQHLTSRLAGIDEISILESSHDHFVSSYYCHTMILSDVLAPKRFDIINDLKAKGVGTSIYYPKPVPKMSFYRDKYGFADDSFPVASRISGNSIALPVGPHIDLELIDAMAYAIADTIKRVK